MWMGGDQRVYFMEVPECNRESYEDHWKICVLRWALLMDLLRPLKVDVMLVQLVGPLLRLRVIAWRTIDIPNYKHDVLDLYNCLVHRLRLDSFVYMFLQFGLNFA